MSTRSTGAYFEKRCRDYLESIGYTVDRARAKVIMIKDKKSGKMRMISGPNDFFGCIDLIGISQNHAQTLFVQCTLDTHPGRKKSEIITVPWNLQAQNVQIWTRQDGVLSGIRAMKFIGAGEWTESIFRMKDGEAPPLGVL